MSREQEEKLNNLFGWANNLLNHAALKAAELVAEKFNEIHAGAIVLLEQAHTEALRRLREQESGVGETETNTSDKRAALKDWWHSQGIHHMDASVDVAPDSSVHAMWSEVVDKAKKPGTEK